MSPDRSAGSTPLILGIAAAILVLGGWALFRSPSRPPEDPNLPEARRLVATWADKLDGQTTDTGVYIRWPNGTLPEDDPWGQALRVAYSQGGVAEHLTVRSAGPDGIDHTPDDVAATRHAVNLKGFGEGVKKNAEETSKNAAKGAVKGLVEGAKEAIKKK